MIKLTAIGHLGKDAIVNNVSGKTVINFTVAHSENYKDSKGEKMTKTTWLECSNWTEKTAIAPYLKKGTQVYIEGTPEVKTFSKADGSTGTSLAVRVLSIQLLSSGGGKTEDSKPADSYKPAPQTATDDDLPF